MAFLAVFRRIGRAGRCLPLLAAGLAMLFGSGVARAQDGSREYQIKAAFLYHFAQFVKWPGTSFSDANAPFCIGILGDDPFGSALEDTVQGETIDSHPIRVRRGESLDELRDCQMIFVSHSEEGRIGEILSQLGARPVLTVSEVESFARNGGDIDFYLSNGKVRFEINPQSAERCGLKMSLQLLSLGRIVEP
ncbi:MAG: YfiR family protein [Methylacidiphilales bacterium]|nr:YfiR family protein [Candidatus Methylacidiphilales bacterium]